MKEYSQEELEEMYKDIKMMDIPSMWDNIERNLASPDERRSIQNPKKKRSFRYIASIAAVFAAAVILIPTISIIYDGQPKSMSDTNSGSQLSDMSDGAMAEDMEEAEGDYGILQDASDLDDVVNNMPMNQEQEYSSEALQQKADKQELEIQVREVEGTGDWLRITAAVVDGEDSGYLPDEILEIIYEGQEYGPKEFQGTLRVQLEKENDYLKLLKIFP